MKNRLYVASVLVLIAILITVVPVSAGRTQTFNVVFPADPITGVNWTPWVTINWEGYRASSVGYTVFWMHSDGVVHNPVPGWNRTSVDPRAKGPQTQTLNIPFTFTRLPDDVHCRFYLGGGIFDAKGRTIQYVEKTYTNICVDQVP